MGYQFKSIATTFVFLGLGLAFFAQNGSGLAEASTRTTLSQDAQAFATTCQNALHDHDRAFSSDVGPAQGCACLASQIAQTDNRDFTATSVLLAGVIAHSETSDISEPDWAAIATDAGISDLKLGELLQASYTAIGSCSAA